MGYLRATPCDVRCPPRPLFAALSGAIACLGAAATLVGQTTMLRREPGPIELEIPIFAGGLGVEFFEETARQFEAAHRDVRVNIYGEPRMHEKMRVRVLDGSFPDATYTELPWTNLIRAGKVVDLTPYLD